MKNPKRIPLFIVYLAFWPLGAIAAEEPPLLENGRQLLLLRNGQVLEGRVAKLKDHYLVDLPDGEIRVRTAEVAFVCRNLEEGYRRKRAAIQTENWRDRLELARWCHKHAMAEHAAAELAAAEVASPGNPLVAALRRQMEPVPESAAKPEKSNALDDAVPNEELDCMVRGLPPKTMEAFTQTVQPMLMNNCTAMGCHGPQSTANFKLFRVSAGEAANRRLTQRNLHAVLQYVNREHPEQSRLLTLPAAPHGPAKKAIFTERQTGQYFRFSQWVMGFDTRDFPKSAELMAEQDLPQNPAEDLPADSLSAPRLLPGDARRAKPLIAERKTPAKPNSAADAASSEIAPASYQEPPAEFLHSSRARPGKASFPPQPQPRLPMEKVKRGAPLPQPESKDPFDPEIFNRRYHKAETPPERGKQSEDAKQPEKIPD
ncbi:MAG: hypothetical protein IT426_17695 [Pirellulales bacterium]|nr:hypothetical protein [Pirellulales bacterium]